MNRILTIAENRQRQAWEIIKDTDVINLWEAIGATINQVGSLKTGLLINNRDIDFHIYTDPFSLRDSFSAMARLAENKRIKQIFYTNLLEAEDKCLEWHAFYEDKQGDAWQIDLIHILPDSPFAGYFEKVADRIAKALTPETRLAILTIKDSIPADQKVMSIKIYQAVIEGGIRDLDSFWQWQKKHPDDGIITWMP
ncbi:hypothetical protein [Dethiosulfatarculus sandiegensis]|uniref:Polymerase nucleotidyl transferase domain-containing protein n=1 Tax=Dethiosulfatarculus sandiegensis TaxID=1429043 RepID=A0A0D2GFM2_9BACT|nr:hypothetical protein [Dethiosulfatarculus sandiegensis]KIX13737.1 hypothetical protein X474_12420 [Dethiosulfatarculus sandiegensis]